MQKICRIIWECPITCILATHDLQIALHYGNKILALREGRIYRTIDKKTSKIDGEDLLAIYH
jgi:ABC-type uncharacterized transport system ATPase component